MATTKRRKPPKTEAIEHAAQALDKTADLEVKFINSFKGRGVFVKKTLRKHDFVVEYRGELVRPEEAERRRRIYHSRCVVFLYDFFWQEKWWCIDASLEDGSLGRLVNDDHNHPNCKMKKVIVDGKPHLCLFALRDINPGEEITYNYGGSDWPWRTKAGELTTPTKSIRVEPSELTTVKPSTINEEAGELTTPTKSIRVEPSELAVVKPSTFKKEAGELTTPTKSIRVEPSELAAVKPSTINEEAGELTTPTKSIRVEPSELAAVKQSTINEEAGELTTPTKSTRVEPSELAAVKPSTFKKEAGELTTPTKSIRDEPSELAAVKPSTFKKEAGELTTPTKSIRVEPSELAAVKQSTFKKECPNEMQYFSLVNYSDSDESQSSATLPFQYSSPCQSWSPSSASDLHYPEKEQHTAPKLRRTKSVEITRLNQFDSDELFDPTSDESEEEYVPETSEDSDGTDTSEVFEIDKKENLQRHFRKMVDLKEECFLVREQNNGNDGSSKQSPNRGRSPTKRRSNSGIKRKKQRLSSLSSHTTCTGSAQSSEQSGRADTETRSENSTPVAELNIVDSTTSPVPEDAVTEASVFIPAVSKKDNGSRKFNKKQYCLYCQEGFLKISRHLERAHPNKPDVAKACSFPVGSKERRLHLEHLRNRGNFAHNVEVLNTGAGNLVPRKQPKEDSPSQNFLHCTYCQGLFTRKVLWRHVKICKFKPNVPQKPGKTRIQALCAFAVPPPPGVKEQFWKLLNNMIQDEVFSAVKSDARIMEFGEHLYNRLGYDVGKHEYIRQKMRELGRLVICSRKITPLKTMEDHIAPVNFMHVVQGVKLLAGFNDKTNTYRRPSLALKIGHSLTKISQLVESSANVQKDYSKAKDARAFRRVYEARWNELVSAASLRTLQESKWNAPQLLPYTKDVQTLHIYLDAQQQHFHKDLSSKTTPETWTQLAKVTLTQVILFNRRRAGEVSKMPLSAYLSLNASDCQEDVNVALSNLEKKLCHHFRRVEIRGKRGRKVPVLLTPTMQQSLDLLVSKRRECGVPQENIYLFARPSALTCYRGSDCLRHFAKVSGAKNPESLTSTKLRKQTGTLSQVLNLTNTELDQLADFLGHDIRVHRQFYRLPEGTLQLAKISKVLLALEQGRLAEFKGKSLDDICIDPEESVHMDSEAEAECESDTQDKCVKSNEKGADEATMADVSHKDEKEEAVTTSQVSLHMSPKRRKGRQPFHKKKWEKEEVLAVEKHMMSFINSCRVPGKRECDECLQMEKEALRNRTWLAVKFYVKNRITTLKKKV